MPDLSAISGLMTSFKSISDIMQALLALKVESEVRGKVVELQSAILSAQSSAMSAYTDLLAATKRTEELEKELAALRAWEAEKQRYALTEVDPRVFVYVLRQDASQGEPTHWLCANCFTGGQKAILQFDHGTSAGQDIHVCQRCKSEIKVGQKRPPPSSGVAKLTRT